MSTLATAWAMHVEGLSPTAKFVLIVLADAHNGHSGECYPSVARIAKTTGFSESTVKYAIRDLDEAGLISRAIQNDPNGRTRGVQYTLAIPQPRGQEPAPRGHLTTGDGSSDEGGRGHLTPPHKDNRKKEPEKKPEEARATRLPTGWTAPPEFIDFAIAEGFTRDDIARRIEPTFRDHWLAAAGPASRKADWLATWRNWIRRDTQRRPGAGKADPGRNGQQGRSVLGAYQRASAFVQAEGHVSRERADILDL